MKRLSISLSLLAVLVLPGPAALADLDLDTRSALLAALDDERHAQAMYQAVIDRFGDVRPFSRIVGAEGRHERHLLDLFADRALEVPPDPWPDREMDVPESLSEACRLAAEAERANIALYDELLDGLEDSAVGATFTRLRSMSADRHLPAFERCAAGRGGGPGPGARPGRGSGSGCCGRCAGC